MNLYAPVAPPKASSLAHTEGAKWPRLPMWVAFLTGIIDLMTWLTLSGYFSSAITGSMAESVSYLVPGQKAQALPLLAVPLFFVGVIWVYFRGRRVGRTSMAMVRSMLFAQFLLLACLWVISLKTLPDAAFGAAPRVAVGVLAILAIALSNATMHLLDTKAATTWALTANSVNATFALLNLALKVGSEEDREADRQEWHRVWPVVASFLLGGLLSTFSFTFWHNRAWIVPFVVSGIMLVVIPRKSVRSQL